MSKTKLLTVAISAFLTATGARADDYGTVWQYELGFSGQQPVHTFSLSFQSRDGYTFSRPDLRPGSGARLALYSTNPAKFTAVTQLSLLQRAADDNTESSGSVGEAIGTAVIGLLYAATPIVWARKNLK